MLAKFGGHRFYGNGDVISRIPWKKLNSLPRTVILREFQNQEYRFTIPKSRTKLAEKATTKRRTQAIPKRLQNAKMQSFTN